jgi:hypothetical protein
MKYLIPILLIIFISSGNAEDEYELITKNIVVDKKICFEAIEKGKVVDKQIEEYRARTTGKLLTDRNTITDIIYKNKYYTLTIIRNIFEGYSANLLPSKITCRIYEETKKRKLKKKI